MSEHYRRTENVGCFFFAAVLAIQAIIATGVIVVIVHFLRKFW